MTLLRSLSHSSNQKCACYAWFVRAVIKIVLFVHSVISYLPQKLLFHLREMPLRSETKMAAPTVKDDPASPWKLCKTDFKSEFFECKTLGDVWDMAVKKHSDTTCLGTRKVISVTKEMQRDGRVFEMLRLGSYQWRKFSEVDQLVKNVAKGLLEIGHQEQERLLIYSETREEFTISMLACFKSNFPVITVHMALGTDALWRSINESAPATIITTAKLLETVSLAVEDCLTVRNIIYFCDRDPTSVVTAPAQLGAFIDRVMKFEEVVKLGQESTRDQDCSVSSEDVALIMYTSGTTAAPKGVILLHKNLTAAVKAHIERFRLREQDRYVAYLPLAHMLEIFIELMLFTYGCKIGFSSPVTLFDGASGLQKDQRGDCALVKPTFFAGTPAIFNRILQAIDDRLSKSPIWRRELFKVVYDRLDKSFAEGHKDHVLESLMFRPIREILGGEPKLLFAGGAPMNPEVLRFTRLCMGCPFMQGYGATEISGSATITYPDYLQADEVGPPTLGVELMLRKWDEGSYSPHNQVPQGEILVGGEIVAAGYLNNEELTKESFIEVNGRRWFATGDIGEFQENGCLRIIDRKKDLLKLAQGEYVSLCKVESYIAAFPLVENVCVCGNSLKEYVVAIIVPRGDQLQNLAKMIGIKETNVEKLCGVQKIVQQVTSDIHYYFKDKLHKMEIPRKVMLCPEAWTPANGMLTPALKIKRKAIELKFKEQIEAMYKDDK